MSDVEYFPAIRADGSLNPAVAAATIRTSIGLGNVENAAASSLYVGLTGNQTIAGNKTFSGDITSSGRVAATGALDFTSTTTGVTIGNQGSVPTLLLGNGTASQNIRIDNASGVFRVIVAGNLIFQVALGEVLVRTASGNTNITGNLNSANGLVNSQRTNQLPNNGLFAEPNFYMDRFNGASTAAGLGVWFAGRMRDTSNSVRETFRFTNTLIDPDPATYRSRVQHFVSDLSSREYLRADTTGSTVLVGIGGVVDSSALLNVNGNLKTTALFTVGTYTVATLPSASSSAGAFAQVTDSNSTTNGSTVAGGGSNRVPVFSDGTNWIIK
jgi:hypothetical protein